jgi:chromatin structure-remodeling complex subunit SFH1
MLINEAAYGLDAGIRLDTESLCSRWSPSLEILSRDEIERREGDRERQIRRLKRDTARFGGLGSFAVVEEEILSSGRRRLKRKRSTSPAGRGTPRGAVSRADSPAIVDVSVARAISLTEKLGPFGDCIANYSERMRWRCVNCLVPGTGTFAMRRGPDGPKQLCNNCGVWYAKTGEVPEWRRGMYAMG